MLRSLAAALHLLALGIGLGAIIVRAAALRPPLTPSRLPTVFLADTLWGMAAMLWIATGLWRVFGGLEKGTAYYVNSDAFWMKMSLLALVLALEVWPMTTLIRWRIARKRGDDIALGAAGGLALISAAQAGVVVVMIFVATSIARGLGS